MVLIHKIVNLISAKVFSIFKKKKTTLKYDRYDLCSNHSILFLAEIQSEIRTESFKNSFSDCLDNIKNLTLIKNHQKTL